MLPAPTGWTVETLNAVVDRELDALPADVRARFVCMCELISAAGLNRVGAPHVRRLTEALWEMRLRGKGGIARARYVTVRRQRMVVVRAFVKKTQKTPRREIDLALRRAREELQ